MGLSAYASRARAEPNPITSATSKSLTWCGRSPGRLLPTYTALTPGMLRNDRLASISFRRPSSSPGSFRRISATCQTFTPPGAPAAPSSCNPPAPPASARTPPATPTPASLAPSVALAAHLQVPLQVPLHDPRVPLQHPQLHPPHRAVPQRRAPLPLPPRQQLPQIHRPR